MSDCTNGSTSSGRSPSGSACSELLSRERTSAARRCSGASERDTSQPITSASAGATASSGATLPNAACTARSWRTFCGCATWMMRSRASTPNVRQTMPPAGMSAKPSTARAGGSFCSCVA